MDKIKIITRNNATGLKFVFVVDLESKLVVPHCQLILSHSGFNPEGYEEKDLIMKAMQLVSERIMTEIFKPEEAIKIINIEGLGCINGDSGFKFIGIGGMLDASFYTYKITVEKEDGN